jgi:hypothetical protein
MLTLDGGAVLVDLARQVARLGILADDKMGAGRRDGEVGFADIELILELEVGFERPLGDEGHAIRIHNAGRSQRDLVVGREVVRVHIHLARIGHIGGVV